MSFTRVLPRLDRLYRSKLFVPGSRLEFFEKAAKSAADVICLDLEDSVAAADKEQARKNVIQALNEIHWGTKMVTMRINGLDTHWCYRDIIDVIEQGGGRLDSIMVPKAGVGADIYAVDMLVSQAEWAVKRERKIGLEVIIESAQGIENINDIAAASPRLETFHFGAADYAASTNMRTTNIGGSNRDYTVLTDPGADGARQNHWGDMWHYMHARMVAAARAHGITPIDGPFGEFNDDEGFRNQATRTAVLGCEGKWAIHPKQVPLANEIYTPPQAEVDKARAILEAMAEAEKKGLGAATLDGMLIDAASIRQSHVIVKKAEQIEAQNS